MALLAQLKWVVNTHNKLGLIPFWSGYLLLYWMQKPEPLPKFASPSFIHSS